MKGSEFLDKLVHLLGEAVPQAVNYLILASSGEIVAELRTKKKCGDRIKFPVISIFQQNGRIHILDCAYGHSAGNFCIQGNLSTFFMQ